jgi:ubiquinone/menaquinone biosynthesis C-methylase UbiE
MAHKEQREFFEYVKNSMPEYFNDVSVIEMGSLNINGTVRDFYNANKYVGVDLEEGPGVDFVSPAQDVDLPDNSFDVAVSAECFEHNPFWSETFENMYRLASKFVIFTCASDGRPEHGTTRTTPSNSPFTLHWDYYKNLNEQDFRSIFDIEKMFKQFEFLYNEKSFDLYFWGII